MKPKNISHLALLATFVLGACDPEGGVQTRSIEPVCVEDTERLPDETWVCPEAITTECDAVPAEIYFTRSDGQACSVAEYLDIEGPFPPGEHRIPIFEQDGEEPLCVAELEVVDTVPPEIVPATFELWPPNHEMAPVSVDDCLAEVYECDPEWDAHFTWITSDEPLEDIGDGHTIPDVRVVSDTVVHLRSERSGAGDGRVYALGLLVEDGSGNQSKGVCHVQVPHDQSGEPAIQGEPAYRVDVERLEVDGPVD